MNWLNLNEKILNSPEFSSSIPKDRGIWISLLRFCMTQENEGVIIGCRNWSEWKWMSTVGIEKPDLDSDSELWSWRGSNLAVLGYPADKEKEVKMRREHARKNGQKGGRRPLENDSEEPKYLDETEPEKTNVGTNIGTDVGANVGKRKRREGKGKETPLEGATTLPRGGVGACAPARGDGYPTEREGYQAAAF